MLSQVHLHRPLCQHRTTRQVGHHMALILPEGGLLGEEVPRAHMEPPPMILRLLHHLLLDLTCRPRPRRNNNTLTFLIILASAHRSHHPLGTTESFLG